MACRLGGPGAVPQCDRQRHPRVRVMALVLPLVIMGLVTTALVITFGRGNSSEDQRPSPNTEISPVTDILPASGEDDIKVPGEKPYGMAGNPNQRNAFGDSDSSPTPFNRSHQQEVAPSLPGKGPQMVNVSGGQPRVGREDAAGRFGSTAPSSNERRTTSSGLPSASSWTWHQGGFRDTGAANAASNLESAAPLDHRQAVPDVASDANDSEAQVASTKKPIISADVTVTAMSPHVAIAGTTFSAHTNGLNGLARHGTASSPPTSNMDAEIWVSIKDLLAAMRTMNVARPGQRHGAGGQRLSSPIHRRKTHANFSTKIPNRNVEVETPEVHKEPVDVKDEEDFRKEHDEILHERKLIKKAGRAAWVVPTGVPKLPH